MGAIVHKLTLFRELITKGIHYLHRIAAVVLSLISTTEMAVIQLTRELVDKLEVWNHEESGLPVGLCNLVVGGHTELQRCGLIQPPLPEQCSF